MSYPDDASSGNQGPNEQSSANGWAQNAQVNGTGSGPAAYPNQPQAGQFSYTGAASNQSNTYHPIGEAENLASDYRQGQPYQEQAYGQQPGYNQQQPYGQQHYRQPQEPYEQGPNRAQTNGQPNGTTPLAGYASGNTYQSPGSWSQTGYQSGYQAGYQPGPQVPQYPAHPYADAGFNGEQPLNAPWQGIDFANACKRFFVKYFVFSGRASRGEYWWPALMSFLIYFVLALITSGIPFMGQILSFLVSLGLFIPNLAVGIRRLHDTNLSGFWILLPFVCDLVGCIPLVFAILAVVSGQLGSSLSLLGFSILLIIAGTVTGIILLARPSDPRGARFDR